MEVTGVPISLFGKEKPMKPFWKKPGKKKLKKHSAPVQNKRASSTQRPNPEPWKPPMSAPRKEPIIYKEPKTVPPTHTTNPHPRDSEFYKEFRSTFRQLISEKFRPWDIWKDFVIMSACAISNTVDKSHYDEREKRYLELINKYEKSKQHLFPELFADMVMALDRNPEQDFLGEMFMDLRLDYDELKQVFTPYPVCQLMAEIGIGDIVSQVEEEGYVTISDPCCGAGANLIAAINTVRHKLEKVDLNYQNHILIVGQDIEEVVALMCYLQISMLGVAGYIKVGNTLTNPISSADTMENYWFTPMYFSDVWHTRRIIHKFTELFEKGDTNEKQP